LEEESSRGEY
jgi:hypothetical protein